MGRFSASRRHSGVVVVPQLMHVNPSSCNGAALLIQVVVDGVVYMRF
jgi:hypothetical protein